MNHLYASNNTFDSDRCYVILTIFAVLHFDGRPAFPGLLTKFVLQLCTCRHCGFLLVRLVAAL